MLGSTVQYTLLVFVSLVPVTRGSGSAQSPMMLSHMRGRFVTNLAADDQSSAV